MEQVRNLPLMNFPISALPTAPGVSRTNKVCKRFPEQKEHLTVTYPDFAVYTAHGFGSLRPKTLRENDSQSKRGFLQPL